MINIKTDEQHFEGFAGLVSLKEVLSRKYIFQGLKLNVILGLLEMGFVMITIITLSVPLMVETVVDLKSTQNIAKNVFA